jgi:hypothetical protein
MFLSKEVSSKIARNIRNNNKIDKTKIGEEGVLKVDEFMEKMRDQNYKCYVCKQEFKYDGDKWCYFFPSADRLNNKKIHSKENIAISCFFCNVRNWKQINEKKCGLCKSPEHTYIGNIQTKSELFSKLHHSEFELYLYLKNMNSKNINNTDAPLP